GRTSVKATQCEVSQPMMPTRSGFGGCSGKSASGNRAGVRQTPRKRQVRERSTVVSSALANGDASRGNGGYDNAQLPLHHQGNKGAASMCRRSPVLAVLAAFLLPASVQAQGDPSWKAGAAKVVITPAEYMWLSGYGGRNKPAEGKVHDLWAKALALEDPAGERVLLITMDLVGIDRDLSQAVCQELTKKYGLPRAAIRLSTSHTHSGPVVRSNLSTMYQLDDKQTK